MTTDTVARATSDGAARLRHIADNPVLESRLLLAHALGVTRNDLIRDPGRQVETTAYEALLTRREANEPLAFITGRRAFWSMEFQVSSATLIPRPDSETLIEAALGYFARRASPGKILDLGTGTGCLLLALLTEFPAAFGIGLDLGPEAAALAKANAIQLGLADRATFVVADWTNPIAGRFDLIICNPPYIRHSEINSLMPDVARHEPRTALDGGPDGYDAYRAIVPRIPQYLEPDGAAILELGSGQASCVTDLASGFELQASYRLDLARIPRAIILTCPSS